MKDIFIIISNILSAILLAFWAIIIVLAIGFLTSVEAKAEYKTYAALIMFFASINLIPILNSFKKIKQHT